MKLEDRWDTGLPIFYTDRVKLSFPGLANMLEVLRQPLPWAGPHRARFCFIWESILGSGLLLYLGDSALSGSPTLT